MHLLTDSVGRNGEKNPQNILDEEGEIVESMGLG